MTEPTEPGDPGDRAETAGDDALASFQAAAQQAIDAARGLLDAAEAVLDDPTLLREAVGAVGSVAQDAVRLAADVGRRAAAGDTSRRSSSEAGDADGPDDDGPVQRIHLE